MARTPDVELRSQAVSPPGTPRMGRRAPPFMRWDQRGKPELQLSLEQADGTTLRVMMGTADWDEAMRRARPIIERAVLEGRLLANSRAARIYGVFDVPEFWADVARVSGIRTRNTKSSVRPSRDVGTSRSGSSTAWQSARHDL